MGPQFRLGALQHPFDVAGSNDSWFRALNAGSGQSESVSISQLRVRVTVTTGSRCYRDGKPAPGRERYVYAVTGS